MKKAISQIAKILAPLVLVFSLAATSYAAVPGITGPSFNLTAQQAYLNQPDGEAVYSWGYGCNGTAPSFAPTMAGQNCPTMQVPGPTLIVHENDVVTINLLNGLPAAAGNTSILFPGFTVTATGGVAGLLTQEAAPAGTVTYTFTASAPGTHAYYSGTQGDLQIEMGLYGAIVVLPAVVPANCTSGYHAANLAAEAHWKETDFRLSQAAYDHPGSCYDREYLFQWAEMDTRIHRQAQAQVAARANCTAGSAGCSLEVQTEPYHPAYFLINGRSMPDLMDPNFAGEYPHQPYNGNPHMHPGENVLMRVVGQGHWQHPFHFHGNHARVLARDANMLVSHTDATKLAGPLLFTIPTVSGQTVDAIFTWTGQGLNWDVYGSQPHTCNGLAGPSPGFDAATHEYCGDHGKPMPVTPPDPSIVVNGQWYAGTPFLGLQTVGNQTPEAPGTLNQNPQGGYAFMWHSHNEREITTNDVFPGGMMMMLLIDPFTATIDETQ